MKKTIAMFMVLVLLIGCVMVGSVFPVVAEKEETFKLGVEELSVVASPTSGVTAYQTIPVLTPDGKPYTESLTWTTSDKSVVAFSTSSSVPSGTFYGVYKTNGTEAVITATNSAGESHSCVVRVVFDGEVITAGDFESAGYTVGKWTSEIIKSGACEVVEDPDNPANHALMIPAGLNAKYYSSVPVKPSTTYRLSFDIKGDTGEIKPLYIHASYSTGNTGWRYATPKATEWKHCSWVFTTKESINRSYIFGFGNQNTSSGTNTNPIYIDNVSVVALGIAESIALNTSEMPMELGSTVDLSIVATPEGATYNRPTWKSSNTNVATVDANGKVVAVGVGTATITATSASAVNLTAACTVTVYDELLMPLPDAKLTNGTITTDAVVGKLKAGDTVTVTALPNEGYGMVPGSLCYVKKDGAKTPILNQSLTEDVFGGGSGYTFEFLMPEETVTLTAEFVSVERQNFQMQTIGTSVHQSDLDEEGNPVYDGVRFLTRVNLPTRFDENTSGLTVLYNGKEYEIEEIGSLLKREENDTALTYDNAIANSSTVGIGKMWVSKAYTKETGVFRLVDYTESYIDFASVMMTKKLECFYTARGYAKLKDSEGNTVTILCDELSNSISTVVKTLPAVETLPNIVAEKWSPYVNSVAVEPNGKLTYTIKVTNKGAEAGPVTVFDPIPENTTYVEGADDLIGKTAVWRLDLAAGETKEVHCTVRVKNDLNLCDGGKVVATTAQVGDKEIACDSTLYVERIVNSADAKYVNTAIKALADSTYTDLNFVYWVYNVAFSSSYTGYHAESVYNGFSAAELLDSVIHGNGILGYSYQDANNGKDVTGTTNQLDNIAPTLYGGTEVTGQIAGAKGAPTATVTEASLMIGDTVIVKKNGIVSVYMYCDDGLMLVKDTGGVKKAELAVLDTLTTSQAYVVLRPRTGLTSVTSSNVEERPAEETYTDYQNALIKTAEAYLMRGQKVQYADTTFGWTGGTIDGKAIEYRWRLREDAPEDATAQYYKYINCSSFCHDVYYFGLNYKLFNGYTSYTCNQMVNNSSASKANLREFYFTRKTSDTHTEEEKKQVEEQFMTTIQPGDLMIILRGDLGTAHVMLYIGNGKMIHATGNPYRYGTNGKPAIENPEPTIRYHQVWDYFFRPTSSNYAFGDRLTTLAIVRPLNDFNKAIPENTINRITNLRGVVAQKLSSHRAANTVSAGDTVTFTFDIRNTEDERKILSITDTVPAGTTYVSGADTVNGDVLSWTVTVPADSRVSVSYTVRVNAETKNGTVLQTTALIGGVEFECPKVTVGNTFTAEEQEAIRTAVAEIKAEGTKLTNIELVNEIYTRAGVGCTFGETDLATVTAGERGVFTGIPGKTNYYTLTVPTEDTTYRNMLVPTLYGGNNLFTPQWQHDRTRLAYEADLEVGDLVITRDAGMYEFFMYTGDDTMFSLTNAVDDTIKAEVRMERLLGRRRADYYRRFFAVLRPSLTNGSVAAE